MQYIWQHPEWPRFHYDLAPCRDSLYRYAHEAGRLTGAAGQLQEPLQYEAYLDLMLSEAINTSRIESENLDREEVRSSIKNFLGLSKPPTPSRDPRAEGIAALMVSVRNTFAEPLTPQRLFEWHEWVIPAHSKRVLRADIQRGQWRTALEPMQIVSGPAGREKVHYEAPPAARVATEMEGFLAWYNSTSPLLAADTTHLPGPVRAAIAHLWFEVIHPFDDGNGRVGRAIAEHALAQELNHPALLSLSTAIEKKPTAYYQALQQASRGNLDISAWVHWFCELVLAAQIDAAQKVDFILQKARFWNRHSATALNARQIKAIDKIFNAGPAGFEAGVSAKKYGAMTACSKATATRDLADLLDKGCIYRLPGGGRNARYALQLTDG